MSLPNESHRFGRDRRPAALQVRLIAEVLDALSANPVEGSEGAPPAVHGTPGERSAAANGVIDNLISAAMSELSRLEVPPHRVAGSSPVLGAGVVPRILAIRGSGGPADARATPRLDARR